MIAAALPRSPRLYLTLGLLCLAPACTSPQPLEILFDQQAYWNAGDIEGFMNSGYENSPSLTFYSGDSVTTGFEATLERYRQAYQADGKEMGALAFTEIEVTYLGTAHALVRGRWQLTFADQSQKGGLFSLIMFNGHDGWRILHDHTSSAAD
jgi:hypothetical protein